MSTSNQSSPTNTRQHHWPGPHERARAAALHPPRRAATFPQSSTSAAERSDGDDRIVYFLPEGEDPGISHFLRPPPSAASNAGSYIQENSDGDSCSQTSEDCSEDSDSGSDCNALHEIHFELSPGQVSALSQQSEIWTRLQKNDVSGKQQPQSDRARYTLSVTETEATRAMKEVKALNEKLLAGYQAGKSELPSVGRETPLRRRATGGDV